LSRRRLDNFSECQIELPHLKDVRSGEAPSESGRQIRRQLLDQLIAVCRLGASSLFFVDDSPTNLPIAGRDYRINSPTDHSPGFFEQFDNPIQQGLVWIHLRSFPLFSHVFPE